MERNEILKGGEMKDTIKNILSNYEMEYVEDYKPTWIKAKLKNKEDLLSLAKDLKTKTGLQTISTVSPTDFIKENKIEVNYFFEDYVSKMNLWLKVDIPRELEECKIDSITPLYPSANWHERESYSTYGVKFEGHPDLRHIVISTDYYDKWPFRKDFDMEAHEKELIKNMNEIYEEFEEEHIENEKEFDPATQAETILHWGPTHPASGPIRLKVKVDGEKVLEIDPDIGFVWRALEQLVERKDFIGAITAVERICFMDNPNPMICYSEAVEEIAGVEITEFAKLMRVVLGETGRVASHLISVGGFFGTMGLQTFLMWCLDVREYFLDVLEDYSGARIATASIEPGGVRYPMSDTFLDKVELAIQKFREKEKDFDDIFIKNQLLRVRAKDNGILTQRDVLELGLFGPIARASGTKIDVRIDEPYAGYDMIDMDYVTEETGDAKDRFTIIFKEIKQSLDIISQAVEKIKAGIEEGKYNPKKDHLVKIPRRMKGGEAVRRVEWARGEMLMHLVIEEKGKSPYRLKIKAPSFNHTMVLNHILKGKPVSDIPLLYGSMHICQGDLDR